MIWFQSLNKEDLIQILEPLSKAGSPQADRKRAALRARQIFHWAYQRYVSDWDQMSDLAKDVRQWLKSNVQFYQIQKRSHRWSQDGTQKFLWDLADHKTVETVVIPAHDSLEEGEKKIFSGKILDEKTDLDWDRWSRLTACISSQVGCTMGCKFCLTGIQGLDRNLETHEIVAQIVELRKMAPITNIVFMGMGEPLHNFDHVVKACQIFLEQDGLNFSKRKVTVSTSGLVPAIKKLGEIIDVSLAISLNATTDEQRDQIMPVNRKWNIQELLDACRKFPLAPHRRITFEYVLLKDFNDSLEDARRLLKLLRGIPHKVNLIPFNEHSGSAFLRPSDSTVKAFQNVLVRQGVTATVRVSRGRDILAACGQLRSLFGTARGTQRHRDWLELPVATEAQPLE